MQLITRREILKYAALAGGALALKLPTLHAANESDRITFALVSDTHLGRTGTKDIDNFKTAVEEINATGVQQVLFCGDLVNAGEKPANEMYYPQWKQITGKLTAPWIAIPGNHDPIALFRKHIAPETDVIVDRPPYRFICFADSKPNPKHDGIVTPAQVQWIDQQVKDAHARGLKTILISHITQHDNKPPNRGWKIEDGREAVEKILAENAQDIAAFFAGHFHDGFLGWQDAPAGANTNLAQIVLPSTSWNQDAHLKKYVDLIIEDYRPAYVIAEATRDKITLRFKPIGAEVSATREILL
jgi:3',5'-cyclic AMP phosphodiesterase CpdA